MPRPILTALGHYPFSAGFVVRVGDLNYGNHLGNDGVVTLLHHARALMFRDLGYTELDFGDGVTGTVMSDLVVSYTAEAFLFDELVIESGISEVATSSFRVHQRMTRGETQIALAEVGIAAFDFSVRKLARFPDALLDELRAYAEQSDQSARGSAER